MKAILEFNLPEDQEQFDIVLKASSTINALNEYTEWLRDTLKYMKLPIEKFMAYDECLTKLVSIMNEHGVNK
jgi:hypothetical protein